MPRCLIRIVIVEFSHGLRLWGLANGGWRRIMQPALAGGQGFTACTAIAASADGTLLVSSHHWPRQGTQGEGSLHVWEERTGAEIQRVAGTAAQALADGDGK